MIQLETIGVMIAKELIREKIEILDAISALKHIWVIQRFILILKISTLKDQMEILLLSLT